DIRAPRDAARGNRGEFGRREPLRLDHGRDHSPLRPVRQRPEPGDPEPSASEPRPDHRTGVQTNDPDPLLHRGIAEDDVDELHHLITRAVGRI
ncbi:MAG: hypothetical protein ACK56I_15675, partial [bacterium]